MCSATIFLNPISSYPSAPHIFPPKLHNFQPKFNLCVLPLKKMSSLGGFDFKTSASGNYDSLSDDGGIVTLREYIGKGGENLGDELVVLFSPLEYACKRIAALVASPFNSTLGKKFGAVGGSDDGDKPKPLDIVANDIILSSLRKSGKVSAIASEEDDAPVWLADDGPFLVSVTASYNLIICQ